MSDWQTFFAAEVGAAAALTGLIFVAISMHAEKILRSRDLYPRASQALVTLIVVLLFSIVMTIPDQTGLATFLETMAIALPALTILLRTGYLIWSSTPVKYRTVAQIQSIVGIVGVVTLGIGAAAIWKGGPSTAFWTVPPTMVLFANAMGDAWTLIVFDVDRGIFGRTPKGVRHNLLTLPRDVYRALRGLMAPTSPRAKHRERLAAMASRYLREVVEPDLTAFDEIFRVEDVMIYRDNASLAARQVWEMLRKLPSEASVGSEEEFALGVRPRSLCVDGDSLAPWSDLLAKFYAWAVDPDLTHADPELGPDTRDAANVLMERRGSMLSTYQEAVIFGANRLAFWKGELPKLRGDA